MAFNFSVYGELFLLGIAFQQLEHASAIETGLLFLPQPIATCLVVTWSGRWMGRVGARLPLLAGLVISIASALLLIDFNGDPFPLAALGGLFLAGSAGALVIPALHVMVVGDAPADLAGLAAACLNAARQVGAVFGVAVFGAMISSHSLASGARSAMVVSAASQVVALALVLIAGRSGAKLHEREAALGEELEAPVQQPVSG
jgi:DHA2 family methylenomycin A resistance protein-like MFS transporter